MLVIFWRQLKKYAVMILGWGGGLALLGFYLFDIYETLFVSNANVAEFIGAFPEELMAFFGQTGAAITPTDFLNLEFFSYIPVILGIMAVSTSSSLIAKKEEDGTLELTLAQPVRRSAVFWGELLALLLSVALILALTWGGFAIGMDDSTVFDFSLVDLLRPMASLYAVLLVYLGLALLLSMVLPSSGTAGLVAGFFLVVNYFISSLANIDDKLEGVNRFLPMRYYQGTKAIESFNGGYLLLLLGFAALLIGLAWFIFTKRDLRFGGSGGFRLALLRRSKQD